MFLPLSISDTKSTQRPSRLQRGREPREQSARLQSRGEAHPRRPEVDRQVARRPALPEQPYGAHGVAAPNTWGNADAGEVWHRFGT